VSIDLLMGEPSARNLIRSGGLRPTGTDAIVTARRTVTPSGGGTTTAARLEVKHAIARSGGG